MLQNTRCWRDIFIKKGNCIIKLQITNQNCKILHFAANYLEVWHKFTHDNPHQLTCPCLWVLGEAGVWGLDGGVIGFWNLSPPSCFDRAVLGELERGWESKESRVSMPKGDGGLSSSVVDWWRVWLLDMVSSTYMLRNACSKTKEYVNGLVNSNGLISIRLSAIVHKELLHFLFCKQITFVLITVIKYLNLTKWLRLQQCISIKHYPIGLEIECGLQNCW